MIHKRSGYTIVEVLVAVIILAIVLPGLAGMVIASRKTQVTSLRMENSVSYGQAVMDELRFLPPERITESGTKTTAIDNQTYNASWICEQNPKGGRNIQITVAWKVGEKSHSTILKGYLP